MTLIRARAVEVPRGIVTSTEDALRAAGRRHQELFVLWSGVVDRDVFSVRTRHVPEQISYRTEAGCGVRVESTALHKLNVWLYEHAEALGVQIHSHPTDAYHSVTDDTYPIVTTEGGLSIVVADFCADGMIAASTAAYRLEGGRWRPTRPEIRIG